jgi:hypothetical protein
LAANESLTVNDEFMVGFLAGDRAYAMGDAAIKPAHIPSRIRSMWRIVSSYYKKDILPIVRAIRDARRSAYRACSHLLAQELDSNARDGIEEQLASLAVNVPMLRARLAEYFALYDGFLGRPALPENAETR